MLHYGTSITKKENITLCECYKKEKCYIKELLLRRKKILHNVTVTKRKMLHCGTITTKKENITLCDSYKKEKCYIMELLLRRKKMLYYATVTKKKNATL